MVYERVGLICWEVELVDVMDSLTLMVRLWAMCIAIKKVICMQCCDVSIRHSGVEMNKKSEMLCIYRIPQNEWLSFTLQYTNLYAWFRTTRWKMRRLFCIARFV